MFDLPRDLLIDILSRLPAKSLGKFKSVSKYWFSLISSRNFVKLHHHQTICDTKTNHSRVFIRSTHSLHSVDFESSSCYEDNDDDDAKAFVSLNDPLEKESIGEKALGSCYGLIFFVCYSECILLWNPTTQTTRLIPDPPMSFSNGARFYGLGYDISTDEHKMVRATCSNSTKSISSEVFNLKTGSWRKVQASYIDIHNPDEIGIFSNGALHWLGKKKMDSGGFNKREVILTFDLKVEVFVETPLPHGGENENIVFSCLGDLKGCLYAAYGGDHADLDIWVMKEYGVENSWSKMITLKWVKAPCDYDMSPICFTLRGDVVIDLDSWNLARFSLTEKTFKKFKKCSTDWHFWVAYTETLVSPYG